MLVVAALGWMALILALTMGPVPSTSAGSEGSSAFCLVCGSRGAADVLLNVALFVPLGWAVARRWGWRRALAAGVGLSLVIEMAQLLIPGRFPGVGDLVANGVGTGLGAFVSGREARVLPGLASMALAAAVVPPILMAPAPPEGTYYGQWTARFGNMAHYEGRVVTASVDGIEVPSWRSDRSEDLRDALARDGPVDVTFVAGPPPATLAPVFSVFDHRRRRIFLLGADGEDIVVHRWTRATTLKLDSPALRWAGAMHGVGVGDTIRLRFARRDESPCLTLNGRMRCDTAVGAGAGWALLISPAGLRDGGRRAMGVLWMVLLGIPAGLARWRAAVRWALVMGAAVACLALEATMSYLTVSFLNAGALMGGTVIGMLLRGRMDTP